MVHDHRILSKSTGIRALNQVLIFCDVPILQMTMELSRISQEQVAMSVDSKRLQLQMTLLRKALDSQQEQADALLRMTEGKGTQVDLRA